MSTTACLHKSGTSSGSLRLSDMNLTNSLLLPGPGSGPKAQAALTGNSAERKPRRHLYCIHVRNRYILPVAV